MQKIDLYTFHLLSPPSPFREGSPFLPSQGSLVDPRVRATLFTRPPNSTPRRAISPGEHLLSVRVARAKEANRPPIPPLHFPPLRSQGEWPRLPFTARIERHKCSLKARSLSLQGWGLIDLPLRASNEGSPRPRVARAQKIIRPRPPILPLTDTPHPRYDLSHLIRP